jgi:glycosyltransferase involved in cell wall biosynthesis
MTDNKIPFFSIITASYNSQKTIAETIKSVLSQHFTNFEYIIVDGDSSDSTIDIIRSFEKDFLDKNIAFKFISEKDKGVYDAWNKGILLSKGAWISFLGSDDTYYPNALEQYYYNIEQTTDINYISSRAELINEQREVLDVFGKPFIWKNLIRGMDTAQVGSFHKRELFNAVGQFNYKYKIVGDFEFYIRCKNAIKPKYFDTVTVKMLNGGISNQIYKALKEALEVKLELKVLPKWMCYYDFYSSLLKCYIKVLINKK